MAKKKSKTKVTASIVDQTGKKKVLKGLSKVLTDGLNEKELLKKPPLEIETHLSHCNQGEYIWHCKYGANEVCPALNKDFGGEVVCKLCGTIATKRSEFCSHQKDKYGDLGEPLVSKIMNKQTELPGMPEKPEECLIAEEILDLKDFIKGEQDKLGELKQKFINQMRSIQKSTLLVKGWVFDVELEDKLSIKKKK